MTLYTVEILGLPVAIHKRSSEHYDTVRRELALIEAADDQSVPARLRALSERLEEEYADFTSAQRDQIESAAGDGTGTIDLSYQLPSSVVPACEELGALLDELDEFCRQGDLLSLVPPDVVVAYRRWFLGEFVRQVRDGAPPAPWQATEHPGSAPGRRGDAPDGAPNAAAVIAIRGDLDLQGASSLRSLVAARFDEGHRDIVFDLADCDFVDSVGLSLLLTTRNRCKEVGGDVRVENPGRFVLSTLRHAGVLDLLVPPEHRNDQPQG